MNAGPNKRADTNAAHSAPVTTPSSATKAAIIANNNLATVRRPSRESSGPASPPTRPATPIAVQKMARALCECVEDSVTASVANAQYAEPMTP